MRILSVKTTNLKVSKTIQTVHRAKLFTARQTQNRFLKDQITQTILHNANKKINGVKSVALKNQRRGNKDLIPVRFYSEDQNQRTKSSQNFTEGPPSFKNRPFYIRHFELLAGAATTSFLILVVLWASSDEGKAEEEEKKRVVVLGSGWAALSFIQNLDPEKFDVVVISPRNYFLFTPMLPSTTTGTIDPRSIIEPIHNSLKRLRSNAKFYEATCTDVDFENKIITCEDFSDMQAKQNAFRMTYDELVIAVGAVPNTFNTPGVHKYAHFLKEISDSLRIRNKIIDCLETANLPSSSEEEKYRLLNFLVVGGGPTGVEFAAELHDFLSEDMLKWYPHLRPYVGITLVQSGDHILNTYDASISAYAEQRFKRENIKVLTNTRVNEMKQDEAIVFDKTSKQTISIPYALCVWSTGISPAPLVSKIIKYIPEQTHNKVLTTDPYLRVKGVSDVYSLGDCSTVEQKKIIDDLVNLFEQSDANKDGYLQADEFEKMIRVASSKYPQLALYGQKTMNLFKEADVDKDEKITLAELKALLAKVDAGLKDLPATAQVASQQGAYLATQFNSRGTSVPLKPFEYYHRGSFAYVGENSAVADLGEWKLSGFTTWWMWRSVYWAKQTSFRNRVMISRDWTSTIIFGRDICRI